MNIDPLKQSQIETIELMAKNEEAIASLYNLYSTKLPEHKDFWLNLSEDEISHARWIRLFLDKFKQGEIIFNKNRFKKEAVRTFLEYLKEKNLHAETGNIDIVAALAVALDIEKALIERNFFEIMDSDSETLQETFSNLASATRIHQEKVENLINSLKNKL